MRKLLGLCLLLAFVPSVVNAQSKPTPAEVKKVLDFYYQGQGLGVVLVDSKICQEIEREGDQRNECAGPLGDTPAQKGSAVYLWMLYMVPSGEEPQNILVQFDHGGVTRIVKELSVKGSLRYRSWKKMIFKQSGNWTAKIIHDKGDSTEVLGELSFAVAE